MLAEPFHHVDEVAPRVVVHLQAVCVGELDRVHCLAVDVELKLVHGAVADPDRAGALVAFEVVEGLLPQIGRAVYAVHDLQLGALLMCLLDAVGQPLQEPARLVDKAESQ